MGTIKDWQTLPQIRIGIAADHAGFEAKKELIIFLEEKGLTVSDFGPFTFDAQDDYPDFAKGLTSAMDQSAIDCGILLCKSGIGMSIHANRHPLVRAALVGDTEKAKSSREHNCSNVLVVSGENQNVKDIINSWLSTPFTQEERHIRRLTNLENYAFDGGMAAVRVADPEIAACIDKEKIRQDQGIELIASENITSIAIQAAQGSCLTNKYAEGYPGKRYYNGCEFVDQVEALAISRACELFGADAANVQPHSGSQANMASYFALISPGDKVLAMSLDHGGHLTHGMHLNFSGEMYDFVHYGVEEGSEVIDYDKLQEMATKEQPKLIVAGASAYAKIIDFKRLREIADSVGAKLFVDMAHIAGLVAAGLHPNPVPYADIVTTTTHKTLRGPRGGLILCRQEYLRKVNSRVFPGIQGGPLEHVIAGKAICFKQAASEEFKQYQTQVLANAKVLAKQLTVRGFRIVSGETDNHLMMVDLRPKGITGKLLANVLDEALITVNKNMIPFDTESPFVTSGIRIGAPAVTTRGMKEAEMVMIADWIADISENIEDKVMIAKIKAEVIALTRHFPLPQFI